MSMLSRAYSSIFHSEIVENRSTMKSAMYENNEAIREQLHKLGRASESFDKLAKQLQERRGKQ